MKTIGIMTGNSLDAIDVIITEFTDNRIFDICGHSLPIPTEIANGFRQLKEKLQKNGGNIQKIYSQNSDDFLKLHDYYIKIVAQTVLQTLQKAKLSFQDIEIIGFHGQTCAHYPPSITSSLPHTLQIGSGQMLADQTGIKVAYDFRSDDIMNGGEGAPLAPIHNKHIAQDLTQKDIFPVVFCNGGNTGNLAVISTDEKNEIKVFGWDTGPFNHFPDYLARTEQNSDCDFNGQFGKQGNINYDLLRKMFEHSCCDKKGNNFLLKPPPKSSDPAWYKILPELTDSSVSFYNRIRTAEFFSAYAFVFNMQYIPQNLKKPKFFLTFGGGWHNPVILQDFKDLIGGKTKVLPEHEAVFANIKQENATIVSSDTYGYNGQYMEARIFADMAKCLITKEPFSYPNTTGCKSPTVGGIIAYPNGNDSRLWSRASFGWQKNKNE